MPAPADVDENELAAALELADTLSFDSVGDVPGLTDHYAQALAELVGAKLHARVLVEPGQRGAPVDLMAALQQSVRSARTNRGVGQDASHRPL